MISTLLISTREFLEAFLMVGVFLGISRKLNLKREKEILLASFVGIVISLLMPIIVFLLGEKTRIIFNESNADMLAGYLMIFSGFFIAYVVFSLHKLFALRRSKSIIAAHDKLQKNMFDLSLFLTIVFFITREGFEIALFTATTSLFSTFADNFSGLMLGFVISSLLGCLTFFAYVRFSIAKVFKYTEYLIVMLGAAFVSNGLSELAEVYFGVHLGRVIPIPLSFLPRSESILGGMLQTMFGISREFSLVQLAVIAVYISVIYLLFLRSRIHSQRLKS